MRKQNIHALLALSAVLAVCCLATIAAAPTRDSPTYIRIASFNIANFGDTNEYERSLISLVNIIRETNPDLLVLQEIEPNELGQSQVQRLSVLLNRAADYSGTGHYSYVIADEHTGDETTAFLWRSPVALESEVWLMTHDEDPDGDDKPTFQRVPHVAYFSAGDFDFYVVNCHLYTKIDGASSEGRGAEYDAIVEWFQLLAQEDETEAVFLGDFNRFLNGKSVWSRLMVSTHEQWFRFPLLEAIQGNHAAFNPAKHEAPADQYSTTTGKTKRIYDQILLSEGAYDEFTTTPQLGADVGIVAFDNDDNYAWAVQNWNEATKRLSDHRPVWIRLRISDANP